MGKAIIAVQMPADASIGPNIGWFESGEQEDTGEDEVRLAGALRPGRKTYESLSALALCGDHGEPMRPADPCGCQETITPGAAGPYRACV
jgi:hypothetical protein